jgi:hypothetical protein
MMSQSDQQGAGLERKKLGGQFALKDPSLKEADFFGFSRLCITICLGNGVDVARNIRFRIRVN